MIIDTHCHPDLKPFSESYGTDPARWGKNSINLADKYSIWYTNRISGFDRDIIEARAGLNWFTQSDMGNLFTGGVDVVFYSLYPLEKGFMTGNGLLDLGVQAVTGFNGRFLRHLQSNVNDYWNQLNMQYEYLKEAASTAANSNIVSVNGRQCAYHLTKNYAEVEANYNNQATVKRLSAVLTIEGAHVFGTGIDYNSEPDWQRLQQRVAQLKAWEHPVFIVGIGHHFFNQLCGHEVTLGAERMVPMPIRNAQLWRTDTNITQTGERLITELLDDTNGRRVYIDIKHFNTQSKTRFYEILNANWGTANLPIVVTHGAVRGDRLLSNNPFFNQNINFTDADIIKIAQSGYAIDENGKRVPGFFGIQLDERRVASQGALQQALSVARTIHGHDAAAAQARAEVWAELIWRQIWHIAKTLDAVGLPAYDIQTMGSDYDGIINSIQTFPTAARIPLLRRALIARAQWTLDRQHTLITDAQNQGYTATQIIDKFLGGNAKRFLKAYYN